MNYWNQTWPARKTKQTCYAVLCLQKDRCIESLKVMHGQFLVCNGHLI